MFAMKSTSGFEKFVRYGTNILYIGIFLFTIIFNHSINNGLLFLLSFGLIANILISSIMLAVLIRNIKLPVAYDEFEFRYNHHREYEEWKKKFTKFCFVAIPAVLAATTIGAVSIIYTTELAKTGHVVVAFGVYTIASIFSIAIMAIIERFETVFDISDY